MSLPRKVLFLDPAPFLGGAQRSLLTLIAYLQRRGIEPVVISGDPDDGGLAARCAGLGVHSERLPMRHWRRSLTGLQALHGDLRRLRPLWRRLLADPAVELVHANGIRAGVLATLCGCAGRPLVFHHRDAVAPRALFNQVAKRATATVMISSSQCAAWQGHVRPAVAATFVTIANGFDLAELGQASLAGAPAELTSWRRGRVVAALCATAPWKGQELFLAALELARRQAPQLAGLLTVPRQAAATPAMRFAEHLCEVPLRDNIMPLIMASDLVVSAAPTEPFGRTVVEALACGKPVVATGGGPAETLADCAAGTIVEPRPEALAAGLLAWVDADRREAVAAAARQRAAAYDIAVIGPRFAALYEQLLNKGEA